MNISDLLDISLDLNALNDDLNEHELNIDDLRNELNIYLSNNTGK